MSAPASPATPADLFALFERLGIDARTYEHPAVFTVAESRDLKERIPGGHSKNLFLKDRKGRLFLVVAHAETRIDLKRLHEPLGAAGRLSFGSAELLREALSVEPGSVTPFAVINDTAGRVGVVLDEALMRHEPVNFHPLVNTATTGVSRAGLIAFLRATGHEPREMRLPKPAENCGEAPAAPS
jgi:Ala-tRNA(Pro) deacylase